MPTPKSVFQPSAHSVRHALCVVAIVVTAALATPHASAAATDDYTAIKQALATGQPQEAMRLVKAARGQQPKDVQLLFFEGVINAQLGETRAAIGIFERMAKDYPELPEPHNNLGVLYAARGNLEEAKEAFERAIFTNPAYATAHQNVADVYAAIARKNYGQALQVDGEAKATPPKVTLLGSISSGTASGGRAAAPLIVLQTPEAAPAAKAPTPAPAKPTAAAPDVKPEATPAAAPRVDTDAIVAVESALAKWAKAWSARDVKTYLASYATTFKPSNGKSRSAWEAERESRIAPRKRIAVTLSNVRVTLDDKGAVARFNQRYESDTFNGSSQKQIRLVNEGGRWLISDEAVN